MKIRNDFVTNSSSSSFIITNKTDRTLTCKEVAEELFSKILEDADSKNWSVGPGEEYWVCCDDNPEKGPWENFINYAFGSEEDREEKYHITANYPMNDWTKSWILSSNLTWVLGDGHEQNDCGVEITSTYEYEFEGLKSQKSFRITNKTDRTLTCGELTRLLLKRVLDDASSESGSSRTWSVDPADCYYFECGDHWDDGAWENFIHCAFGSDFCAFFYNYCFGDVGVIISLYESHH